MFKHPAPAALVTYNCRGILDDICHRSSVCGYIRQFTIDQGMPKHLSTKRSEEDDPDLTQGLATVIVQYVDLRPCKWGSEDINTGNIDGSVQASLRRRSIPYQVDVFLQVSHKAAKRCISLCTPLPSWELKLQLSSAASPSGSCRPVMSHTISERSGLADLQLGPPQADAAMDTASNRYSSADFGCHRKVSPSPLVLTSVQRLLVRSTQYG